MCNAVADRLRLRIPTWEGRALGAPLRFDRIADVHDPRVFTARDQLDSTRGYTIVAQNHCAQSIAVDLQTTVTERVIGAERDFIDLVNAAFESHRTPGCSTRKIF